MFAFVFRQNITFFFAVSPQKILTNMLICGMITKTIKKEFRMAKINQLHETNIFQVDEQGTITKEINQTTVSYDLGQEPPYIKMYLDTVLYLKDIPKGYNSVLLSILKRIPWANQNQEIAINAHIKRGIASELQCSYSTVEHAITDFVKGEVLLRVGTGTYQVNPHLFGRGEWKDIGKLRLTIDFDANGKTIMGEVIKKSRKPIVDENQLTLPLPEETNGNEYIARAYIS
jgi:hypothetical protein